MHNIGVFHPKEDRFSAPHLIERINERLETGKVSDKLEDPHDAHHPDQPHDLPGLPHDLEILKRVVFEIK